MLNFYHKKVIFILTLGAFLPLLDITIINLSINSINNHFESNLSISQWVVTSYSLLAACVVPISGWLCIKFDSRRVWILGLFIFTLSSFFCALSNSIFFLILFRCFQGVGAGILIPLMQTLLIQTIGSEHAKLGMARLAVPAVIAPIIGPIIGGFLTQHFGWQAIFMINIPLGIMSIIMTLYIIKKPNSKMILYKFDWIGFVVLCPSLILIIYGFSNIFEKNHISKLALLITITGITLFSIFIFNSKKMGKKSLIDLTLFESNHFLIYNKLIFISSLLFYSGLFVLPIYFIHDCNFDLKSVSIFIGLSGVGTLIARYKLKSLLLEYNIKSVIIIAVLLTFIGTIPFIFKPTSNYIYLIGLSIFIRGAGLGILTIIALSSIYETIEVTDIPQASTISRVNTQIASAFGTLLIASMIHFSQTEIPSSFITFWSFITILCLTLYCGYVASKIKTSS